MTRATELIWQACGSPNPFDMDGAAIRKAKMPGTTCALCGRGDARYDVGEFVSNTFSPTRNDSRLAGFGGSHYCAACVFCSRTLRLRCISWFASSDGIRFWRTRPEQKGTPQPDALLSLLEPPEPPFVVGLPLYGIKHGGENHWRRTPWPGNLAPDMALKRLQSKHVAIYSRVATSRDRYPVQVDDGLDFVVDRDAWLRLRDAFCAALQLAISEGVPPYPAKMCIKDNKTPRGLSPRAVTTWKQLTAPFRQYIESPWWWTFCDLYPTPTREETEDDTTDERADESGCREESKDGATPACVPAQGHRLPDEPRQTRQGQILLPF